MARSAARPSLPLALAGALSALVLATAAPAALASKAQRGVVLATGHGTLRLVDSHHRVTDVHVRSARGLKRGAEVAIRHGAAQVTGHARTISFYGRVVRSSSHGAVLRLGDGSTFKVKAGGGHGARLVRGQRVLVTLAAGGHGNVAKAVKPVAAGGSSSDGGQAGDQGGDEVDGVVTDIADDSSSIGVDPGDGSDPVEIPVPDASLLSGVQVGDQVAVTTDDAGNATEIDVLDSASSDDGSDGSGSGDGGQQSGDGSGDGGQQTGDAPDDGGDS
jgi:hypothetical protein